MMTDSQASHARVGEDEHHYSPQTGGGEDRRRRTAPLGVGRGSHAAWTLLLLAAASGLGHVASVDVLGYPCEKVAGRARPDDVAGSQGGREGSHLVFDGFTSLLHSGGNSSLYTGTFTVELFAKFTDSRAFQPNSEVTLVGNMRSGGPTPAQGNSGWKIACSAGVCCLKAYLKQIPHTEQTVCTHDRQGTPILEGQWFHLSARYEAGGRDVEGPRGKAAIFVNGLKHNEAEWGNRGRGAINYPAPYAPFEIGGPSTATSPSYFRGQMDEVRIWQIPLTDAQILDTSYETAWRSREPDGTCVYPARYSRIASVEDLSGLILYIKDPTAATAANQNVRGQPWINSSSIQYDYELGYIDKEPLLELLPTSRGVLADVWPRVSMYGSGMADDVTVVVSQSELTVLEMRVRDPNYDDVVTVKKPLMFVGGGASTCIQEGIGLGEMEGCDADDTNRDGDYVGWISFAGVDGYEGMHTDGTLVNNSILVEQTLDTGNLIKTQDNRRGRGGEELTLCRGNNSAVEDQSLPATRRFPRFLPPYTDVQSRIHVRLVWSHSLESDWWMPEQGFEYSMVVRSYQRYNQSSNDMSPRCGDYDPEPEPFPQGLCLPLKLGMHMHLSPEFVNRGSYPKPRQAKPEESEDEYEKYAYHSSSLNAVKDGDSLAVAIGETLKFTVRVQDRNLNDTSTIKAREDPGLPPGHITAEVRGKDDAYTAGLPAYPARSQLSFPDAVTTLKLPPINNPTCPSKDNYESSYGADWSPPDYVDRVFTYKPREQHAGGVFRVCLYAESLKEPWGSQVGLRRYDAMSKYSPDLCVRIKVLVPTPMLVLPRGDREFEAIVGCKLHIPLELRDAGPEGYDPADGAAVTGYKYVVVPTVKGSEMCSSSECSPMAAPGLPRGMEILNSNDALGGNATLVWTPERGQELDKAYRICVQGRVDKILPQYSDLHMTPTAPECFHVRVRKCQECVRPGQSLASIATSLKADVLGLYLSNPFLQRPEDIKPGTVLSTGPLYTVREGDFVEALSNRFLVPVDTLLESNPDVRMGNGTLSPGLKMCVRAPVCDVKCKFGTECTLPGPS